MLFTPTCRSLLGLFFQREKARTTETWVSSGSDQGAEIKTIAVLGAGTMGAGIAQLAATSGYQVVLKDIDDATVQKGMQQITSLTEKGVKKGALKRQDADKALAAITPTTDMQVVKQADVVERAGEDIGRRIAAAKAVLFLAKDKHPTGSESVSGLKPSARIHFNTVNEQRPVAGVLADVGEETLAGIGGDHHVDAMRILDTVVHVAGPIRIGLVEAGPGDDVIARTQDAIE